MERAPRSIGRRARLGVIGGRRACAGPGPRRAARTRAAQGARRASGSRGGHARGSDPTIRPYAAPLTSGSSAGASAPSADRLPCPAPAATFATFSLEGDKLPADVAVTRFEAVEAISTPYAVEVRFATLDTSFRVEDCPAQPPPPARRRRRRPGAAVRRHRGPRRLRAHRGRSRQFDVRLRPALAALAHREGAASSRRRRSSRSRSRSSRTPASATRSSGGSRRSTSRASSSSSIASRTSTSSRGSSRTTASSTTSGTRPPGTR